MSFTPIEDEVWKLLPSNSTPLERDVLKIVPFQHTLMPTIPLLNTFKRIDIPDQFLPWLDIEYGLARLSEFLPDARERLEEGLLFNREIGTAAAILRAAGWLDLDVELWEEPEPTVHFAEFQLKLISEIPSVDLFCVLARAMKIAKPARSRFRRIYNPTWDVRHFVLDSSDWGDLLSDYSGARLDDRNPCGRKNGLVISLGREHWMLDDEDSPIQIIGEDPVYAELVRERCMDLTVSYPKWPILDEEYYLSFYPPHLTARADWGVEVDDVLIDAEGDVLIDAEGEPLGFVEDE